MGCIDMHAWASRADKPERPDWVMFDLDPAEGSGFDEVIEVALLVRQTLDVLELESVPKTSGSRGIHVLVPITRGTGSTRCASSRGSSPARSLALTRASSRRVDEGEAQGRARRREPERPGQDDGVGLLRASTGGRACSTPLRWDEVRPGLETASFTMDVVLDRVAREGDLFARVLEGGQSLGRAFRALR